MPVSVKSTTKPAPSAQTLRALARQLAGQALGFSDCPAEVLDELVALGQLRHLKRGEYAVHRGDAPAHVWLVVSGLFESSTQRADGHRHLLGLALPGDFFALMALVDGHSHSHDLTVREDSVAMLFAREGLQALRKREPSLVLACELQIAYRSRLLFERLAADPGVPLEVRAAGMLQTLATLYGRAAGSSVTLDVKLSQSDLADWLGLSRQRVNFALKQLEAEGLIALHYSSLTILDAEGLRQKAGS